MTKKRDFWRRAVAALVALLVGAAWLWLGWGGESPVGLRQLLAAQPPGVGLDAAQRLERMDWRRSVLLDARGGLRVQGLLRQHFDELYAGSRGRAESELREQLERRLQRELDEPQRLAVLQLWDQYLSLRHYNWRIEVDLQRIDTWELALEERHAVREQLLGAAWAEAFYGAEERRLRAWLAERKAEARPA